MDIKKGDLVACYLTNTSVYEALLQWGVVLDVNESIGDIFVLDNHSIARWYPRRRWRLLEYPPGEQILETKKEE